MFCIFFLCLFGNTAQGRLVPAYPSYFKIQFANGDSIYVKLVGDENAHWLETENGQIIIQDNTGVYIYANDMAIKQIRNKYIPRQHKSFKKQNNIHKSNKMIGHKHTLVLLLNYSDIKMQEPNSREEYYDMFNKDNYNNNNHVGSVRDYFRDQSYQQLTIDFDVIGPIELNHPHSYYGENTSYGDKHPREMIEEAINMIKDSIDFSRYDWDGDGEVEQIVAIYAGYGEHSHAPSTTIWPHAGLLSSGEEVGDGTGAMVLNNTVIDTYIVVSELIGNSGCNISGIGPICHEFSHTLGLPDFYDTSSDSCFGMKRWDIMDVGNYSGPNNRGEVPSGYTSYERWKLGWLIPDELSSEREITNMENIGDTPQAYVVYNPNNSNEYYLLENRSPNSKWFQYLGKNNALEDSISGLLVIHVDYDNDAWTYNCVNADANHPRMSIIPANNDYGSFADGKWSIPSSKYKGHLYPYNANNSLTATSIPSALLFNKNCDGSPYLHTPITNIILSAENKISFVFNRVSSIAPPTELSVVNCNDTTFFLKWSSVDNAVAYNVEITIDSETPYLDTKTFCNLRTEQTTVSLKSNDYKFRVQSVSPNGIPGEWSQYKLFPEITSVKIYGDTHEKQNSNNYMLNGMNDHSTSDSKILITKQKKKILLLNR